MSLAKKIFSLLIFNILAFGASAWGSYVTNLYKEPWYSMIAKPSFNPPEWVFAPVWTTLYIAMSVAIWLVWINPKRVEKIIYIYFIHLLINGSWSIFFFGLHLILASLMVIAIIIFFVIWLIKLYYPINKLSSFLMVPYLMWLSYAFVLNFYIFILN
jgi:tryptophan-rich sensory protein